jgi:hypothetical protein
MGNTSRWVKCAISAKCKIDISVVLTDTSNLDPHMIRNGSAGQKMMVSQMEVATSDDVYIMMLLTLI